MVKISAQILGRVIGNSEVTSSPSERTGFSPSPEQLWCQVAAWISANPCGLWSEKSKFRIRPADPRRTLLAPGLRTTMHGGVCLDNTMARKSPPSKGSERLYEKSKVYCKLYFASLSSSFLQDLLISMIFSQMYLLTLEVSVQFQFSSTVSCAILSYKHSRQGKETKARN